MTNASAIDPRTLLEAVEAAAPVAAPRVVADLLRKALGASEVRFLIADFSGRTLTTVDAALSDGALPGSGEQELVSLFGTPQGEALETQTVRVERNGSGVCVYAPVTARGEAVGVLELRLDAAPTPETLAELTVVGHVLAYVVIANRRYTDLFEWGQRSLPLSLAAEIQHRLLPGSYTCEAGQFTLAAWLEPAGDVGGDTFDFSLERDTLHLSMTDAMGHTVEAAMLATIAMGALRNARRAGVELAEQTQRAHEALVAHASPGQYVTGQVARISLDHGTAQIVNAGHPPPLRLRGEDVERVLLPADPPLGTFGAGSHRVHDLPLQPGDRLLFLTDGMLERGAARLDIGRLLRDGRDRHPREAVQQLAQAVLEANDGELADDATALVLDWHGGPQRDRTASAGANRANGPTRR